jgi:4-hydroxymandelate oxidase
VTDDHRPPPEDPVAFVSLPQLEQLARATVPHMAFEYIDAGAADEHTLRWNRDRYAGIRLRPRVLQDVGPVDTRVRLLGREHGSPILLAPTGYHRILHPEGEIATARGAAAAGVTFVVSASSTTAIGEIARSTTAPLWFQLYIQSDRAFTADVVAQAHAAGCEAICLTVDSPVIGARNRQAQAGFRLPADVSTPHLFDIGHGKQPVMDPRRVAITWKDVEWLGGLTALPVVLKGILDDADAERAVQSGAHGIIVSNHGARTLDTAPATIDALPAVAERVAGRVPVLIDGGIRRGTDVIKAIALGATAVLVGRPYCFGLAVAGSDGVERVIAILRQELEMAMMLIGRPSIASIDRSALWEGR